MRGIVPARQLRNSDSVEPCLHITAVKAQAEFSLVWPPFAKYP